MRLVEIFDDIDALAAGGWRLAAGGWRLAAARGRKSSRDSFQVTGLGASRYLFRRSVRFIYFDNSG